MLSPVTAEKCLCGHLFAASRSDESVDDEVIAIGELLVEGGAWLRSNVSLGNDDFLATKGDFAARKAEVGANTGFGLLGGELVWFEQCVSLG